MGIPYQTQSYSWHTLEAKVEKLRQNEINRTKRHCQIGNVIGKPKPRDPNWRLHSQSFQNIPLDMRRLLVGSPVYSNG